MTAPENGQAVIVKDLERRFGSLHGREPGQF